MSFVFLKCFESLLFAYELLREIKHWYIVYKCELVLNIQVTFYVSPFLFQSYDSEEFD